MIKNIVNQVGSLNSNWQAVVSGVILLVVTAQRWPAKVERR